MYLSCVKIWNFRKYGYADLDGTPALEVSLKEGLNILIGENDTGKTAIIDAIKFVLGTRSHDTLQLKESDFYENFKGIRSELLKIECVFQELSDDEAGSFLEWLTFDGDKAELCVRMIARHRDNRIIHSVTAGMSELDTRFDAIELLRVTYLKPLRDAENELKHGYHSRLAQVLLNHPLFVKEKDLHVLERYFGVANQKIEEYFKKDMLEKDEIFGIKDGEKGAKEITEKLETTLREFMGNNYDLHGYEPIISASRNELTSILRRLSLIIAQNQVGLGSLNQLFIALELLLFDIENRFNIALIEEIEAHLHPQAQLRLIAYLQNKNDNENSNKKLQCIITTHSITLASKIKLSNLIYCKNNKAYLLDSAHTALDRGDYKYLERFLDSTKANLFFAKGIIFVEGDAENILIPVIANIIGMPLEKYGVSIVNVGSLAFLRYANIFRRKSGDCIDIPLAIVTDLDVRPDYYYEIKKEKNKNIVYYIKDSKEVEKLCELKCSDIEGKIFIKKEDIYEKIKEQNKLKKLSKKVTESIESCIKEEVSTEQYRNFVLKRKIEKYCTDKARLFTNNWTLEYDIALSVLRDYLYASVIVAKKVKKEDSIEINLSEELLEAKRIIDEWSSEGDTQDIIAYKIYEDLLLKNASKAVTAQYFSEILEQNAISVNAILAKDESLSYLKHAIMYACGKEY
ncbi:MAG: AAA family ATPase [Hungatella sp.]|nr:AAA family ATPase [Hungatella sp.]